MRLISIVALSLFAGTASADGLDDVCVRSRASDLTLPCVEGSFWTAGGVSHVPGHESLGAFGIGTDVTLALARYHGFPSGAYGGGHGDAEIRGGIWGLGTITGVSDQGALIEGGVEVIDGGGYHASWGTFDLRVGAGYGSFTGSRSAHGVVTLGYGVRSDLSRYRWWRHRPRWPESYGEASIARLVFTVRRTSDTSEILIGMELSPTFFLPPVTWWRIAGGPPQ